MNYSIHTNIDWGNYIYRTSRAIGIERLSSSVETVGLLPAGPLSFDRKLSRSHYRTVSFPSTSNTSVELFVHLSREKRGYFSILK